MSCIFHDLCYVLYIKRYKISAQPDISGVCVLFLPLSIKTLCVLMHTVRVNAQCTSSPCLYNILTVEQNRSNAREKIYNHCPLKQHFEVYNRQRSMLGVKLLLQPHFLTRKEHSFSYLYTFYVLVPYF